MKIFKSNALFVVILVLVVTVTSLMAFGYGVKMGGDYKGTYADVYGEGYHAGLEDGYTMAFLDVIVYNQSVDTAVNLGIVSPDNVNLNYYRKVWNKYIEEGGVGLNEQKHT